jgi:hypothetical protein
MITSGPDEAIVANHLLEVQDALHIIHVRRNTLILLLNGLADLSSWALLTGHCFHTDYHDLHRQIGTYSVLLSRGEQIANGQASSDRSGLISLSMLSARLAFLVPLYGSTSPSRSSASRC